MKLEVSVLSLDSRVGPVDLDTRREERTAVPPKLAPMEEEDEFDFQIKLLMIGDSGASSRPA